MKGTSIILAMMALCVGLISGCTKRYVGKPVNYNWEGWCVYTANDNNGEKHCRVPSGALIFDLTITKSDVQHEYIIDGFVDPTQGAVKSWDRMVGEKSRFNMVVANDGVIVDNVSFRPRTAYGGLGSKMPFTIKYTSAEGFDAVSFYWSMTIRG